MQDFVVQNICRLKIGIEMLTVQHGTVATGRSEVSVDNRVGKGQWSRRLDHRVVLGSKDPPRRLSCVSSGPVAAEVIPIAEPCRGCMQVCPDSWKLTISHVCLGLGTSSRTRHHYR